MMKNADNLATAAASKSRTIQTFPRDILFSRSASPDLEN